MFVVYKICPLILDYNDGLDDNPFISIGQHDAIIIGRQLQNRRAKQAVTPYYVTNNRQRTIRLTEGDIWDPSLDGIDSVEVD